jgi:hypothetical protein
MRALMILLALAAACAPQNGANGPTPDAADGTVQQPSVRGTVSVVGSAPVNVAVVVRDGENGDARIEGPLADEIGRLAGAEVEVTGERRSDPMYGSALVASAYRVVSVGGAPVVLGVVERDPTGMLQLRTDDGTVVRLSGPTAGLRVGQKVWVQGPPSVEVRSFGVVRP